MKDHVDRILEQWEQNMPMLDVSSMAIFGRIVLLNKVLEDRRSEYLEKYGFKEGEFDVLATLRRSGSPYRLTPTLLYQQLLVTSGAMTNRLQKLENLQLIERAENQEDKRSMDVLLTTKGLELIEQAVQAHVEIQNDILNKLDVDEKEMFINILTKLLLDQDVLKF